MSRRPKASIVASPVLMGAVTLLVVIVAVFLAYNANQGLPFVPTYDLRAELPSGGKLVRGNEVRVGGFRVGIVEAVKPAGATVAGRHRAIAVVELKLDKSIEPLARDTIVRARSRSALGLKYIELVPGDSARSLDAGDTIPLTQPGDIPDVEDVFAVFDRRTRAAARAATEGFGDALSGRGASLNAAVAALNPLFQSLTPVMRTLSAPETELDRLFRALGRTMAQAAPVARTQAQLFTSLAEVFAAVTESPEALRSTIEKGPPTIEVSISSLRAQRPFFGDLAALSRRLRPGTEELVRSLPPLNRTLALGTAVLPETVPLNARLADANEALGELFGDPSTLLALKDLRTALAVTRPAVEYIAPYQTVCNDAVYFFHPLGEVQSQVQRGPTGGGTVLQQGAKLPNSRQPNNYGTMESSRPWDVPPEMDPIGAKDAFGGPLMRPYVTPDPPAIDAQGNADCEIGQWGYVRGPLIEGGRYGRGLLPDGTPTGGNWPVVWPNYPTLAGGTYITRKLGIENLKDVP